MLSEDWIGAMRSRAFLLEAHHTTHIEGTRLTLDEAARVLGGEEVPGADPDDARELLNYRRAFEFVSTHFNAGTPIRERLIREIHWQLVDGVRGGAAAPGEYRRVQNYVVNSATGETIYTPPPPGEVPDLMRALVAWLNGHRDIHPVIASAIAQFQLVHIHPSSMATDAPPDSCRRCVSTAPATTSSDSLPSASTTTATGWLSTERFRAYVKRTWT